MLGLGTLVGFGLFGVFGALGWFLLLVLFRFFLLLSLLVLLELLWFVMFWLLLFFLLLGVALEDDVLLGDGTVVLLGFGGVEIGGLHLLLPDGLVVRVLELWVLLLLLPLPLLVPDLVSTPLVRLLIRFYRLARVVSLFRVTLGNRMFVVVVLLAVILVVVAMIRWASRVVAISVPWFVRSVVRRTFTSWLLFRNRMIGTTTPGEQ